MIDYKPKPKENLDDTPKLDKKEVYKRVIEIARESTPQAFAITRKYNEDILKELGVGLIDNKAKAKIEYEFPSEVIKKYGLSYFYNRVIIPFNEEYFCGRSQNKNVSKKNIYPPRTKKVPFYIASQTEPKGLIVVEGETDAIATKHIYPEYDIVSCGGVQTSIIGDLHNFLRTRNIIICFDKDNAGFEWSQKLAADLKEEKFEVQQIIWPGSEKDIDEVWFNRTQDSLKIVEFQVIDVLIDKDFKPITKEEYKKIILDNFPGLWETVDLCLSVISINKLKHWTDPVNINLVGPPSSQKTTAISFFYGIEGLTYKSDSFTPKAFVSHSATVEKDKLEEIDLLPKIRDKCFLTPELGPIFGKRKEDLLELIGILTRVFDGEGLETDSGSQGHRGYSGEYLFTMVGATTPLPKTAWNIMSKMGSRMFFFGVPHDKVDDDYLSGIIDQDKDYGGKIQKCKEATKRMLFSIFSDGKKRTIDWKNSDNDTKICGVLINAARMMCKLRASIQVWDDDYTKEVYFESPQIEQPMRIINILLNLAKGHAITCGRTYVNLEDMDMMPNLLINTMPEDRTGLFLALLSDPDTPLKIDQIAIKMNTSEKIARKALKTFEVLGIVKSMPYFEEHHHLYTFSDEFKGWLDTFIATFPIFTSVLTNFTKECYYIKLKNRDIYRDNNVNGNTLAEKGKVVTLPKSAVVLQDIVCQSLNTTRCCVFDDIATATSIPELELQQILLKMKEKGLVINPKQDQWILV